MAWGSSWMRAPSATFSTPPSATLAMPLALSVRFTGARTPGNEGASTGVRAAPPSSRPPLGRVRRSAVGCQFDSSGARLPGSTSRRLTPSRLKLPKPPCEKKSAASHSCPGAVVAGVAAAVGAPPSTSAFARSVRLPALAPASATPCRRPCNSNRVPTRPTPSVRGLLLSTILPALPPFKLPVLPTRRPPDTSISVWSPSTSPAPERSAALPPAVGSALPWPSSQLLATRPARSITTPSASTMSPERLLAPAAVLRALVCSVTLPPAALMSPASAMPRAPRVASTTLLARLAASASLAPGSVIRLPSVASVTLPKPASVSVEAATRDSAGSAACSGWRQKSAPRLLWAAPRRSVVSTPVPAKPLPPKAPALSSRPNWKRAAVASASTPLRWRSPTAVVARKSPSSTACAAVTSNCPPLRPSV